MTEEIITKELPGTYGQKLLREEKSMAAVESISGMSVLFLRLPAGGTSQNLYACG